MGEQEQVTATTTTAAGTGGDPWIRMVCDADSARQFLEDACAQLARVETTAAFLAVETVAGAAADLRERCAGLKAEALGLRLLAFRESVRGSGVSGDVSAERQR